MYKREHSFTICRPNTTTITTRQSPFKINENKRKYTFMYVCACVCTFNIFLLSVAVVVGIRQKNDVTVPTHVVDPWTKPATQTTFGISNNSEVWLKRAISYIEWNRICKGGRMNKVYYKSLTNISKRMSSTNTCKKKASKKIRVKRNHKMYVQTNCKRFVSIKL